MNDLSDPVDLRYQYFILARKPRCRMTRHLVSEVESVRFRAVDAADTRLVARVKTGIIEKTAPTWTGHTFDYRIIDGRLMREAKSPQGGYDPLTLKKLAACGLDRSLRRGNDVWPDCPVPPAGPDIDRECVDRSAYEFRDITEDGREAAWSLLMNSVEGMRLVDGVLYRPSFPPVWKVASGQHRLSGSLTPFVPDYAHEEVRRFGFDFSTVQKFEHFFSNGFIDARVPPKHAAAAILRRTGLKCHHPDASTIRVFDPDAFEVGFYDRANAILLKAQIQSDWSHLRSPYVAACAEALERATDESLDADEALAGVLEACEKALVGMDGGRLDADHRPIGIRLAIAEIEAPLRVPLDLDDDLEALSGLQP